MQDLPARLAAALGVGYRLGRELSGGGMSRVFLAEEVALRREVVVKLPIPELIGERFVERFRQEIEQTARLQHPSIVPVLSTGTLEYAPGLHGPYYIMPYIRGETLRSRIEREGSLSVAATVRVVRDVLEALIQAHGHGVVHRDIKPENIFISGGHAVVADFGIAKALALGVESEGRTAPGMAVGTPAYMAPEQAVGDPDTDHRADLYALGLVAYEMLSGQSPFGALPNRQLIVAHAQTRPEALATRRSGLPRALTDAVMRCLEKEPADRWQTADEMLRVIEVVNLSDPGSEPVPTIGTGRRFRSRAALFAGLAVALIGLGGLSRRLWWPTAGPAVQPLAIAVLMPSLSDDSAGLSLLATEFQEEVTHDLRWVKDLEVLDYLAVEAVHGEEPRAAAGRLGVDFLVRTRLLPSGEGATVQVNLIDARAVQVWNRVFDVPRLADFHQAHQRITDSLAMALGRRPSRGAAGTGPSPRGEAYALYRDAQKAVRVRTRDSLQSAMDQLTRALTLNPDFAEAHAELANAYSLAVVWSYRLSVSLYEAAARSLAHADRAVALAPTFARAYTARANIRNQVLAPVREVRADFDRSREFDPGSQPGWYAALLLREGRTKEALDEAVRGVALDPASGGRHISVAFEALALADYPLAVRSAEEALQIDSTLSLGLALRARGLLADGQFERCATVRVGPYLGTRAACLRALNREPEAQAMVDSLLHLVREPGAGDAGAVIQAQELAIYFASNGEATGAGYWVREAFELSPIGVDHRLLGSALFARVMQDRSFRAVVDSLQAGAYPRVRSDADRLLRAGEIQ